MINESPRFTHGSKIVCNVQRLNDNLQVMAGCVTKKKMYPSLEIAEDALIEAWTRYEYANGNGPVAVYQCNDCGQFHLTSIGEMNPRLRKSLDEGEIKLRKEANSWIDKFNKR